MKMARPKKNWDADVDQAKEKLENKASSAPKTVVETSTTSVKAKDVAPEPTRKSLKEVETPTEQNIPATEKKKLPQVIITYQDKNNRLVTKVYTCYELNIHENTQTTITGTPSGRKDIVDLSLDAKVVGIE